MITSKKEAIQIMLDGKILRDCNTYFQYRFNVHNECFEGKVHHKEEWGKLSDINRQIITGCEVYQEPKKKVKLYKYLVKHNTGFMVPSDCWYSNSFKYMYDGKSVSESSRDFVGNEAIKIQGQHIEVEV